MTTRVGGGAPVTLSGHSGALAGGAVSPDGTWLVTWGEDATLRLWDATTGACLRVLAGPAAPVESASFRADGARLLTCHADGRARLWRLASGRQLPGPVGCGPLAGGGYVPGWQLAVLTGRDGTLWWWPEVGAPTPTPGHTRAVTGWAASADGTTVATASYDGTVRLWDTATRACLRMLAPGRGPLRRVALSGDGRQVAASDQAGRVWLWRGAGEAEARQLAGHRDGALSLEFSADGALLLSVSCDGTARVWQTATGACLRIIERDHDVVVRAAFCPTGRHLVVGWDDTTVELLPARKGPGLGQWAGPRPALLSVGFADAARVFLVGEREACLREVDGAGCLPLAACAHPELAATACTPTAILTAFTDGAAWVWRAADGRPVALTGHADHVSAACLSEDGRRALTTSFDGTTRLWDVQSGVCLHAWDGWGAAVALCPDGATAATGGVDGLVRLRHAAGRASRVLAGHSREVAVCAFDASGQRLLTGSDDSTTRLWDAQSGDCLRVLRGTAAVTAGVWAPGGAVVALGDADGTVHLWDAESGERRAELPGHSTYTQVRLSFSPDGRWLLATDDTSVARLWDAHTGRLAAELAAPPGAECYGGVFVGDSAAVATGHANGTVRSWRVPEGRVTGVIAGPPGGAVAVGRGPGATVWTVGRDGAVRQWDLQAGQQVGFQGEPLPGGEILVRAGASQEVIGASPGAGQWLGHVAVRSGRPVREPVGPLPGLPDGWG
ncbi:WD40 repeat domain-containing protein [Buchananella hordeovulneris]|uniref:WD40 repeat domain-containing protein n=1 Tax=Buchananella hordeovulneris TaxID=52770 RepID=UPI00163A4F61|nr:WD40 repeat domain-containing protein [Buchananella hordeovulneris]